MPSTEPTLSFATKRKQRRRWVIGILAALVVMGFARFVLIPAWLPAAIVYAPNFGKTIEPEGDPGIDQLTRLGVSRQERVAVGPPAASLSIWIVEPAASPVGTLLVLHGIRDSKRSMLGLGQFLARHGHRAILVDLRGHGRSSGDWLTYGVVESQDLSQVLDHLAVRSLLTGIVGAIGCSYGGAVALQLAARDERIQTVAAIATFTHLTAAVTSSARQFTPRWLITEK